jgi:hypothetical protein
MPARASLRLLESDRHPQTVAKFSKEEVDFFFSPPPRVAIASLQYPDEFRSIRAALFNVSGCKLSPSVKDFAAEK